MLVLLIGIGILAYQGRVYIWAAFNQPQMFFDPVLDQVAAPLVKELGTVPILSFSKTNGFRHHQAIAAATQMFDSLASENGWQFFHTENGAYFTADNLARFRLVILSHKSGTTWTASQRLALREYVEKGGTLIALHAAGDASNLEWRWYAQEVIRTKFVNHPMRQHIQQATLTVENLKHPATRHLSSQWQRADEWYNFDISPRQNTNVLVSLDENSYDPEDGAMGKDHPIVWWHNVEAGRVLFNAMGHTQSSYSEPDYLLFMQGMIEWGLEVK